MYELYVATKSDYIPVNTTSKYNKIITSRITHKYFNLKEVIFWNLITFGKAKAYIIKDDENRIIHSSFIISKCFKFPFMRKKHNDIEIGPCCTSSDHRGQGLYPYVLSSIIANELGETDKAFMIISDSNLSSINGVLKAGFRKTAILQKHKFKRYIILE